MEEIRVVNRQSRKVEVETVFGDAALRLVYGQSLFARLIGQNLLLPLVRTAPFAKIYGYWQRLARSRKRIRPFIKEFQVDTGDFADSIETYASFDAFFTRKLKAGARPLSSDSALLPADGRYRFIPSISAANLIQVKGQSIDLSTLLGDQNLAQRYEGGSMVMARLCPTDYHRYHFPIDCIPSTPRLINGWLYSVNPIALNRLPSIFTENRRYITELDSKSHGRVQFIEVGASCVGSVHHSFEAGRQYKKGDEKGYFSFGASALILLFEKDCVHFSDDLLDKNEDDLELLCLMGQSLLSPLQAYL